MINITSSKIWKVDDRSHVGMMACGISWVKSCRFILAVGQFRDCAGVFGRAQFEVGTERKCCPNSPEVEARSKCDLKMHALLRRFRRFVAGRLCVPCVLRSAAAVWFFFRPNINGETTNYCYGRALTLFSGRSCTLIR